MAAIHSGLLADNQGGLIGITILNHRSISNTTSTGHNFRYNPMLGETNTTSYSIKDDERGSRFYSFVEVNTNLVVQTIAGAPTIRSENSCGYKDAVPRQEAQASCAISYDASLNKFQSLTFACSTISFSFVL